MKKSKEKQFKVEYITFLLFGILNVLLVIYRIHRGDMEFQDFHARWQECAYFLRGINPFDVIGNHIRIEEIGNIDPDMVTVPWAWIWGNIFNPGFLPYSIAKIWGVIVYAIVFISTGIICAKYFEGKREFFFSKNIFQIISLFIFIILSQYSVIWSFLCGNQGALVCCIVIDSIMVYEKHPYIAGILMTIALIKPQISLPFFLIFLLIGQYRLIIVSALLELITISIIYISIGVDIITLMLNTSNTGTNLSGVFFGLLNILKYWGISTKVIVLFDMILGIVFATFTALIILRKNSLSPLNTNSHNIPISIFYGATVTSTFWFYKQSHDFVICAVIHIIILFYVFSKSSKTRFIKAFILQLSLLTIFYFQPIMRRVLMYLIPSISETLSKEIFMNLTCIWLIVSTIIFMFTI